MSQFKNSFLLPLLFLASSGSYADESNVSPLAYRSMDEEGTSVVAYHEIRGARNRIGRAQITVKESNNPFGVINFRIHQKANSYPDTNFSIPCHVIKGYSPILVEAFSRTVWEQEKKGVPDEQADRVALSLAFRDAVTSIARGKCDTLPWERNIKLYKGSETARNEDEVEKSPYRMHLAPFSLSGIMAVFPFGELVI